MYFWMFLNKLVNIKSFGWRKGRIIFFLTFLFELIIMVFFIEVLGNWLQNLFIKSNILSWWYNNWWVRTVIVYWFIYWKGGNSRQLFCSQPNSAAMFFSLKSFDLLVIAFESLFLFKIVNKMWNQSYIKLFKVNLRYCFQIFSKFRQWIFIRVWRIRNNTERFPFWLLRLLEGKLFKVYNNILWGINKRTKWN